MAASRSTPLSAADKFYIEQHLGKMTTQEMAKAIGCNRSQVDRFVAKVALSAPVVAPTEASATPAPLPEVTEPEQPSIPAHDTATGVAAIGAQPIVRPEDGITIMTEASAQWADEVMKRIPKKPYAETNKDRVFQPRPKK